jgi:hypothetical protein
VGCGMEGLHRPIQTAHGNRFPGVVASCFLKCLERFLAAQCGCEGCPKGEQGKRNGKQARRRPRYRSHLANAVGMW